MLDGPSHLLVELILIPYRTNHRIASTFTGVPALVLAEYRYLFTLQRITAIMPCLIRIIITPMLV